MTDASIVRRIRLALENVDPHAFRVEVRRILAEHDTPELPFGPSGFYTPPTAAEAIERTRAEIKGRS